MITLNCPTGDKQQGKMLVKKMKFGWLVALLLVGCHELLTPATTSPPLNAVTKATNVQETSELKFGSEPSITPPKPEEPRIKTSYTTVWSVEEDIISLISLADKDISSSALKCVELGGVLEYNETIDNELQSYVCYKTYFNSSYSGQNNLRLYEIIEKHKFTLSIVFNVNLQSIAYITSKIGKPTVSFIPGVGNKYNWKTQKERIDILATANGFEDGSTALRLYYSTTKPLSELESETSSNNL